MKRMTVRLPLEDLKIIEEISQKTGGKSFVANNEKALEEILREIDQLERTEIQTQSKIVYDELFYRYLFWGVALFMLCELLRKFLLREVL